MRFLRVYTRKDTGEIVAVFERDSPFIGHECEMTHRGDGTAPFELEEFGAVAEDFVPETAEYGVNREMQPMSPARHLFERMRHEGGGVFSAKPGQSMPALLDCPSTLDTIKARLRAQGPQAVPVKVRAWLANILPRDQVAALGIGRGLPISAMKAAEAVRNRRDPAGGSRLEHLERVAQRQSDARAARRSQALARRAGQQEIES